MRRTLGLVVIVVLAGCTVSVLDDGQPSTEPTVSTEPTATFDFQPADRIEARVTAVVDGDTVDVRLPDGSEERVRLVGIDTPEVHVENDPLEYEGVPNTDAGRSCLREVGQAAGSYAESRLAGENVTLLVDPDTDRRGGYGRLLAYVVHDGTNVNYELVATGHARVYETTFTLREDFESAEGDARDAGRGLWRCRNPT